MYLSNMIGLDSYIRHICGLMNICIG